MTPKTSPKNFAAQVASFVLAAVSLANAQDSGNASKPKEETVVLSPFSVVTDRDVGYVATTSLAGTRLNTELRDIGAPVQVLTSELFKDLGATDAATILSYATSMEVTGTQGNYAGGLSITTGVNDTNQRTWPQTTGQRVRGLASASLTRNYFLTDIPFDDYNTDQVTISRGPNSLLFGIGSVGGVINNDLKQALTNKNAGQVGVMLGERGTNRETLDLNRVLIPGRLAVRVATMAQDIQYRQRPAFAGDKRLYAAVTAVLYKGKSAAQFGDTVVKVNVESGRSRGSPPEIIPPADGISPWFSPPEYSAAQVAALNNGKLPAALQWMSNGTFTPKLTIDNRNGTFTRTNIPNTGIQPYFFNLPVTYTSPGAKIAGVGLSDPSVQGIVGRVQWQLLNPRVPPHNGQVDFLSIEPIQSEWMPGYTSPVIQNRSIIDNTKLMLSGNTGHVSTDISAQNFTLEQSLFKGKAGFQLAYDRQRYNNESQLPYQNFTGTSMLGGTALTAMVDINQYFGNLEANPNLGRIFVIGGGNFQDMNLNNSTIIREAKQATAFYTADFTQGSKFIRWLGVNTLTGYVGRQGIDTLRRSWIPVWVDVPGGSTNVAQIQSGDMTNGRRVVWTLTYITPSLLGGSYNTASDVHITDYITTPVPKNGEIYTLYDSHNFGAPILNPANNTPVYKDQLQVYYALNGNSDHTHQNIDSRIFSWQGRYLGGNLVSLFGWRRDKSVTFGRSASAYLASGEWDSNNLVLNHSSPITDSGNTRTMSFVGHIPQRWLGRSPIGVSVEYSQSENFSAVSSRNDVLGNPISSPTGSTRDYGVTFELVDKGIALRINRFETKSQKATVDTSNAAQLSGAWISLMLSRAHDNSSSLSIQQYLTAAGQPADAASRFSSYQDIYNEILKLSLASSHGNQYSLDPGSFGNWLNPVPRVADTTDFVAQGLEAELVGNITPKWRIYLSVAKQETVQANTAALEAKVAYQLRDEIASSKLNGILDSASRGEPYTFDTRLQTLVLNGISALQAKDGTASPELRKWRANLVSDYEFSTGLLKDFSVGGALRWQSAIAIGYPELSVISGAVTSDIKHPYYGKAELNGDMWVGYSARWKNNYIWKVQLNVRNLVGERGYIPVVANPDGRIAIVRNPDPMEFSLRYTLYF